MDVKLLNRDLALLHSRLGTRNRVADAATDDPRGPSTVFWGGERVAIPEPRDEHSAPGRRAFSPNGANEPERRQ